MHNIDIKSIILIKGKGWPSGLAAFFWIRRCKVRSLAASLISCHSGGLNSWGLYPCRTSDIWLVLVVNVLYTFLVTGHCLVPLLIKHRYVRSFTCTSGNCLAQCKKLHKSWWNFVHFQCLPSSLWDEALSQSSQWWWCVNSIMIYCICDAYQMHTTKSSSLK